MYSPTDFSEAAQMGSMDQHPAMQADGARFGNREVHLVMGAELTDAPI
jgi:hypothetical protein